jgi:cytochrome bd-type quinol oxidase subunit 2
VTEPSVTQPAMTVRASVARWVTAMPPLLRIGLALAATVVGLSVSERSLYRQLGFPAEVGHAPASLLLHPVVVVLVGVALVAWMMLRRRPAAEERRQAELLLHGALIALLAFGWVAAFAQANSAQAAFQRGATHLDYPLVAPLPIQAWPAEVTWRADVPTAARVADGPVLFVRWTGGTVWCWDIERRLAVGVPAVQIALVRTQGLGVDLARPDVPTTVSSPYRRS